MLRLSKLTDYGTVVMTALAEQPDMRRNASELAAALHLSTPTVSKILKTLARNGLLTSSRGVNGGYLLSRSPTEITMSDVIAALEGPIALIECAELTGQCSLEPLCSIRGNWLRINLAIRNALEDITLADMISPLPLPVRTPRRQPGVTPPPRTETNA